MERTKDEKKNTHTKQKHREDDGKPGMKEQRHLASYF